MPKTNNALVFTNKSDLLFDELISAALHNECEILTNVKNSFERKCVYLTQNEKKLAGAIYYIYGKNLWCDSIYVDTKLQNQGIGKQLISKLIEIAEDLELSEIQLNTYFPKAVRFFTKCGFKEVATIPNWKYGLTCYLMKKTI